MADKYDRLKLCNQLCFPLYAASKEIVRRYKPFLDKLNMTYTQYIAMMAMWEHRELTVKEIGELLYLDSGTMTPLLKTMEKKGWVERKRSKEDERVLIISLTDSGEKLKDKALEIPGQMSLCIDLDSEEAAELSRTLNKILNNL